MWRRHSTAAAADVSVWKGKRENWGVAISIIIIIIMNSFVVCCFFFSRNRLLDGCGCCVHYDEVMAAGN